MIALSILADISIALIIAAAAAGATAKILSDKKKGGKCVGCSQSYQCRFGNKSPDTKSGDDCANKSFTKFGK